MSQQLIRHLKEKESTRQFIRFCINGIFAAAIHYGVYFILQLWIDVNIAYTVGYLVSFAVNFIATNYYTFHTKPTWKNFMGFAGSHSVNYFLHIILFNIFLQAGIHRLIAPPLVMLVAMLVQFTILRFVFGKHEGTSRSPRFYLLTGFLFSIHLLGLAMLSLFRVAMFASLYSKMSVGDEDPVGAFLRGLWFDNVVGCYILVAPLILGLLAATFRWTTPRLLKVITVFVSVCYVIVFAVSAANIPYYAYFAKTINASIFNWFGYAETTTGMIVGERSYWLFIALFLLAAVVYVWLMTKLCQRFAEKIKAVSKDSPQFKPFAGRLVVTLMLGGLCIFGIRGRTGYNPIKISQAYYCQDPFLNQLGIAPAFNLLDSWLDTLRPENKELHLMPYSQAISMARQSLGIEGVCDSTSVLRRHIVGDSALTAKPNVVIILMESMSGAFLQTMGQPARLTPVLDSLYRTSWAFTNFYSAGIHTNHGITASLYSFPALMERNLMKGTVTPHRHGVPTVLHDQGYYNMFFMTHESQYDNMSAFLHTNGYDGIYAQEDYPFSERVNAFGVSDHFLFDYGLEKIAEADRTGKPWMATLLTVSNHPPYVIPEWFKARSTDKEQQIVEYADWCIGDFLRQAREQAWYRNTIFVILADHGKIVGEVGSQLPESYNHVPLIIFGPHVQPRQDSQLATQVDIMPTLLDLMGISYDYEGFGINLATQHRDMVFYTADDEIVGRDHHSRYIFVPATGQAFCEGSSNERLEALKNYAISMIQTAEFMQRQESLLTPRP